MEVGEGEDGTLEMLMEMEEVQFWRADIFKSEKEDDGPDGEQEHRKCSVRERKFRCLVDVNVPNKGMKARSRQKSTEEYCEKYQDTS